MKTGSTTIPSRRTGNRLAAHAADVSYFSAMIVIVFFAAALVRFGFIYGALSLAMIVLPFVAVAALSDRVILEHQRLERRGLLAWIFSLGTGRKRRLKFAAIQRIETHDSGRFRIGSKIYNSYRTYFYGPSSHFVLKANRRSQRRLLHAILSVVPDDVMDARSIDLRDHLVSETALMHLVDSSGIPSREVLEDSRDFGNAKRLKKKHDNGIAAGSMQPEVLQRLGNQLRVAGSLTQAMEAFRRASVVRPPNASLLFDYGRCMLSYAALERDAAIERRGIAMMRLAERRAGRDAGLLSLLGEAYVNAGDFRRAAVVFRNCSERVEATFRSVRWQAELALREGKFAHVVHNFSVAHRLAKTSALKRWTRKEVDYFTRLSVDDEYMALEFSRLGLEDRFRRLTVSSLYLVSGGLAAILAGAVWDLGPVSDSGWAISGVALLVWAGAKSGRSMFATRIPAEIVER